MGQNCCKERDRDTIRDYSMAKLLVNHRCHQDDVRGMDKMRMNLLERYTKVEKQFPFYRMEVNGFLYHLWHAMNRFEGEETSVSEAQGVKDYVLLDELVKEFDKHPSWSQLKNK